MSSSSTEVEKVSLYELKGEQIFCDTTLEAVVEFLLEMFHDYLQSFTPDELLESTISFKEFVRESYEITTNKCPNDSK